MFVSPRNNNAAPDLQVCYLAQLHEDVDDAQEVGGS